MMCITIIRSDVKLNGFQDITIAATVFYDITCSTWQKYIYLLLCMKM